MPENTRTATEDGTEVVKWYTRARRFPQLIGKTPDGATIWGGPYTYTQVIVGVGLIVVGSKTTWLWGHFGVVGNALILLGASYGLVLGLGRLPIGSRNPLSVVVGAIRAMTAPAQGRLAGSPARLARPHQAGARLVISPPPALLRATTNRPVTTKETARPPLKTSRVGRPRTAPPGPTNTNRPPASLSSTNPPATPPALTGVQRLLASGAGTHSEN